MAAPPTTTVVPPPARGEDAPACEDGHTDVAVGDAITDYLAHLGTARPGVKPPTQKGLNQKKSELAVMALVMGTAKPVGKVSRRDAGRVKDFLEAVPARGASDPKLCGLDGSALLEAAKAMPGKRLNPRTINGHLDTMRGLFAHLDTRGLVEDNPFAGIAARVLKGGLDGDPFTPDELEFLFNQPLFTGAKSDHFTFDPGSHLVGDWRFWAPLIAFFTGARIGEIAQLMPGDVVDEDGVWLIGINDDRGKRLKTASSRRRVPVHDQLVRLGLVQLARERKASARLLPDPPVPVQGAASHKLSDWFSGRFLPRLGIKRPRLGFHAFRHTFKTLLRDARVDGEVQDRLMGCSRRCESDPVAGGNLTQA